MKRWLSQKLVPQEYDSKEWIVFITGSFTQFEFKRAEYSKAFDTAIKLAMRNAARAWHRAAVARVPIRTGFAMGTLLNLTTAIGLSAATNRATFLQREEVRRGKARKLKPRFKEYYRHDSGTITEKHPEAGRRFSTPPGRVFTNFGGKYFFNYGTSVTYYRINELSANSKVRNTPWKSFEAGMTAYQDYLANIGLKTLPAITEYVSATRVSVGRNGKTVATESLKVST